MLYPPLSEHLGSLDTNGLLSVQNMDRKADEQVGEDDHRFNGPVQKHVLMTHPESVPDGSHRTSRGSASQFHSVPLVQGKAS